MTVIAPYTPHTRMIFRALVRMATDWYEQVAEEYDLPVAIVDEAITDYAMFCARVTQLPKLDFALTTPQDTPDTMRANFEQYLKTARMDLVRQIEQDIIRMDRPRDEDLAPGAKPEGED